MANLTEVTLSPSAFKRRTSLEKESGCELGPSLDRHRRSGALLRRITLSGPVFVVPRAWGLHSRPATMEKSEEEECTAIVKALMRDENAYPFLNPVDPIALGCPTYFDVIKNPMDFETITVVRFLLVVTIQNKLENKEYESSQQVFDDVAERCAHSFVDSPHLLELSAIQQGNALQRNPQDGHRSENKIRKARRQSQVRRHIQGLGSHAEGSVEAVRPLSEVEARGGGRKAAVSLDVRR